MNDDNKPLIYLLNTQVDIEGNLIGSKLNAQHYWLNGYSEHKPAPYKEIIVPYSYSFPDNLHEAEIIVLDTSFRKKSIGDQDSILGVHLNHTPKYIDLMPLDSHFIFENIYSTEKDQLIVIFCEYWSKENYRIVSENGGTQTITSSTVNIRYGINISQRTGTRISINKNDDELEIKGALEKYLPKSHYKYVFDCYSDDIPLLINEAGEVVGLIREVDNKKIFLLPAIENKKDLLSELFTKILPNHTKYSAFFPNNDSFKWVSDFSYISIEERNKLLEIEQEHARHKEYILNLEGEYNSIHNRNENVKLRNILKETGDELVLSVKWFLEYIGFTNIENPDKKVNEEVGEVYEEDLNFEHDGMHFLLEVKGIGGTSTDSQCSQISKIALRRRKANPQNTYKSVYIVNHQRFKAPKERDTIPFNQNQITDSEISHRGMTFTYELFQLYHMIEAGILNKKDVRNSFTQEGLINFRSSLHLLTFNHRYPQPVVYSFSLSEISDFSIKPEDKIVIQDNQDHWHVLTIEGLEVDRKPVEEVSVGNVGVKVDRLITGAKNYYLLKQTT